jgi:hypothetical protein
MLLAPIFPKFMHEHIDLAEVSKRYGTLYMLTSGLQQRYTQRDMLEMTHCQMLANRNS